MSRIGKHPVKVPKGVTAKVEGQKVSMKGPKGELQFVAADDLAVTMDGDAIALKPRSDTPRTAALWGMSRTMVANLIEGVTKGFEKKLQIQGVGFRAAMAGKDLKLSLGFSHDVVYSPPKGITIATPTQTDVVVSGIDRQQVGQVAYLGDCLSKDKARIIEITPSCVRLEIRGEAPPGAPAPPAHEEKMSLHPHDIEIQ